MVGRPKGSKNRANRNSSSVSTQQHAEFFKIFLPEHNSKTLVIPPDFVDNFKGKIPNKAILRNLQGKSWQVELEKIGGRLLIKKGWEAYVRSHSLVRGDFLIFRYNGDSSFNVKVFGINGCKKNETTTTLHHPEVKVEQEAVSEQVVDHQTGAYEKKHPIKGKVVEEESQEPMTIPEKVWELSNIRFSRLYDICRGSLMFIPGGFIRGYNIKPPRMNVAETISLRDLTGGSQPLVIIQTSRGQVQLCRGWKEFCSKHKFAQGDECEFEIILGEGRRIKEIKLVRISRKKTVTRNTINVL